METIEEFIDLDGNKWRKSRTTFGTEINEMIYNKKEEDAKVAKQKENERIEKVIKAQNEFDKDLILNSGLEEGLKRMLIRRFKL